MAPLWRLGGHLGSNVSALVDGQLDPETAERAWGHVLHCPPCRRLVEREGWVKRRLSGAPRASVEEPPEALVGSLLDLDPAAVAWADTDDIERRSRGRRRTGIVLVGAGSVSAAVLGLTALGGPLGQGGGAGTPASQIGRSTSSSAPTRATVAPASLVHGRLPGWRLGPNDPRLAHAVTVGDRP